jgi:hypothetical protein
MSALNGRVTPWDGQSFAFLGNMAQGTATMIKLPELVFRAVMNNWVKTINYMVTNLAEMDVFGVPFVPMGEDELGRQFSPINVSSS